MLSIPEQLARIRAAAGLTQAEVAQRAGTSAVPMCRWESGARSPQLRNACTWAAVLGHRLVVTRDGRPLGEVLSLPSGLSEARVAAGLTQSELARRMYVARNAVCQVETRSLTAVCSLVTAERYLTGCGYRLDLEATPMAVAA